MSEIVAIRMDPLESASISRFLSTGLSTGRVADGFRIDRNGPWSETPRKREIVRQIRMVRDFAAAVEEAIGISGA